jgi:membrane protease YdiL (CAAX protease family)
MVSLVGKGLLLAGLYIGLQILLTVVVRLIYGIDLFDEAGAAVRFDGLSLNDFRCIVALNQVFGFLLPAVIYLWTIYGARAGRRVYARIPDRFEVTLFALAALVLSFSGIQFLTWLNGQLPLGDFMSETGAEISKYMLRLLDMEGRRELLVSLMLIGILPAIAEELFFRGVVQNELIRHLGSAHLAIWLTAAFFSAIHFQFEGFLPRFYLGALLGYVYYYSKSLFIPVLLHFTNNAILVVSIYFAPGKLDTDLPSAMPANFLVIFITTTLMIYFIYLIKKQSNDEDPKSV